MSSGWIYWWDGWFWMSLSLEMLCDGLCVFHFCTFRFASSVGFSSYCWLMLILLFGYCCCGGGGVVDSCWYCYYCCWFFSVEDCWFLVLNVGDLQIDHPVGEVEADEAHWEDDSRVLINVWWVDPEQLVGVFASESRFDFSGTASRSWRLGGLSRWFLTGALGIRFLQLQIPHCR